MTPQPAGEHHTGTLNLAGQGNPPQVFSDELVRLASFTIAGHRAPDWDNLPDAMQAIEAASYAKAMRTTLEAAYPAIRQQVAEQIAAAIEVRRSRPDEHGRWSRSTFTAALTEAAQIAREIGGVRS